MKKHAFFRITQHLSISLSIAAGTLVILNYFNPMWGFLASTYSQIVLFLLCIVSIAASVSALVVYSRQRKKLKAAKRARVTTEDQTLT